MKQPTAVLYIRIPESLVDYVRGLAEDGGLSMAQVTAALIGYCRDHNLEIVPAQLARAQEPR